MKRLAKSKVLLIILTFLILVAIGGFLYYDYITSPPSDPKKLYYYSFKNSPKGIKYLNTDRVSGYLDSFKSLNIDFKLELTQESLPSFLANFTNSCLKPNSILNLDIQVINKAEISQFNIHLSFQEESLLKLAIIIESSDIFYVKINSYNSRCLLIDNDELNGIIHEFNTDPDVWYKITGEDGQLLISNFISSLYSFGSFNKDSDFIIRYDTDDGINDLILTLEILRTYIFTDNPADIIFDFKEIRDLNVDYNGSKIHIYSAEFNPANFKEMVDHLSNIAIANIIEDLVIDYNLSEEYQYETIKSLIKGQFKPIVNKAVSDYFNQRQLLIYVNKDTGLIEQVRLVKSDNDYIVINFKYLDWLNFEVNVDLHSNNCSMNQCLDNYKIFFKVKDESMLLDWHHRRYVNEDVVLKSKIHMSIESSNVTEVNIPKTVITH